METTRLSSKGQIIIPQSIRVEHHWDVGTEFLVIECEESLLLTPIKPFKTTSLKEIIGCVGYKGPKKSLKSMKEAIAKGAKERK